MARVLYVVNIPRFFVTHRLPLALAARERGYDVHVTTSDADAENVEIIKATGLPYHPLPLSQHGTNPLAEINTIRALYRLYKQLKPDLVHQVSIKPVIYGGLAAKLAGVPAVVSAMSGLGYVFIDDSAKAQLLRLGVGPLFRLALAGKRTRMIFQNPDDQQRFIQMGLLPQERTVLIKGSGVDMDVFSPQPEPGGLPVFLFAGRLLWSKGLGTYVELARRLQGKAKFVVAGYPEPSSPHAVPMSQMTTWRDEGIIDWWGRRDDMPDVFASINVVCLPSTYGEGIPKVLIEAAACGRAILTTDTPGCREIVTDGENGLLVAPDDFEQLVAAAQRLIDDADLRRKMGENGRKKAAAEYSLQHVVDSTFALYEALLAQR
ncbi:MAG: glycosyltransferase family 4 protein [Anaerolineae bacterium]|nr:glycosyltransferase family 4 protein [Anaerolineae bacterium]